MFEIDLTPVRQAGLRPADLAKLVGVGRVSCSYWLNGYQQPHHLHRDKVQTIVDDIKAAAESGLLPVPVHVMRRERAHYIRQAIDKASKR